MLIPSGAMTGPKLTNDEVYQRLHEAGLALGNAEGETVLGDTALRTARQAIVMLQMGMVKAEEAGRDTNPAIKDPTG